MNSSMAKMAAPMLAKHAAVIVSAALVGAALGLLYEFYLFEHWSNLGWRRPIADWLIAAGFGWIAGTWGLVWLHLPAWLISTLLGVCLGLCLRRRWSVGAIPAGLTFVFANDLWLLAGDAHPLAWFGPDIARRALLWESTSVVLVICFAYFSAGTESSNNLN